MWSSVICKPGKRVEGLLSYRLRTAGTERLTGVAAELRRSKRDTGRRERTVLRPTLRTMAIVGVGRPSNVLGGSGPKRGRTEVLA